MSHVLDAPDAVVAISPSPPDSATPSPPVPARSGWRWWVLALVVLVVGAIAVGRISMLLSPSTAQVVTASGRIEGRDVTLAAKVIQGRVTKLMVDEGERVTKGQLLAELDAAQVDAQLAAAQAGVAALDAQVSQASLDVAYTAKGSDASIAAGEATLSSAQAHAARAVAVRANAAAAYERADVLFRAGAISKQDLDAAEMTLRTSAADVTAAEKDVARASANLTLTRTSADTVGLKRQQLRALEESRRTAAARLAEADANVAERRIIAPEDGTVVSRVVEVGDVVSPGTPLFHVVDMNRLYLKVYIPEPDIAKLRLGDAADIIVDAFPSRRFPARISKIYEQAEFTPKNVETTEERLKLVFGVELALTNTDGLLKPGMPADGVIHWTPPADRIRHGS